MEGDFTETDNCQAGPISSGSSCQLQVVFVPTATGNQTGQIEIFANVDGGQLAVELGGSGTAAGVVSVSPASVSFGQVEVGTNSSPLQVEVTNSSSSPVPINSITITQQFVIASNACGTASLAANAACQLTVAFAPTAAGQISGIKAERATASPFHFVNFHHGVQTFKLNVHPHLLQLKYASD